MPDFDEFYESRFYALATAVRAAVERGDAAAACETVLAAEEFYQTVERLPSLPVDVRRRLAHACVRLYKAADTRERRDRLLTVHAWLLARRVDLLESDGVDAEMLAALPRYGSKNRANHTFEAALASEDFSRVIERLRALGENLDKFRNLTIGDLKRQYKRAEDPRRREQAVWMATVLDGRLNFFFGDHERLSKNLGPMAREALDHCAPERAGLLEGWYWQITEKLSKLPSDVRRRLDRYCADLLATAEAPERREPAVWMRAALTSYPHESLGSADVTPMLKAAAERGDAAAACAMVLWDEEPGKALQAVSRLRGDAGARLLDACVDEHESADSKLRKGHVLHMHSQMSMLLNQPDDRLESERRKHVDEVRSPRGFGFFEMAWVELACGRDIPVSLGAALRHDFFGQYPPPGLRKIIPLLADRHPVLNAGQPWSDRALAELADLPAAWTAVVKHAATATKPRPGAAWQEEGRALLAAVDEREFRERTLSWLTVAGDPRSTLPNFDAYNYAAACNLVWLLSLLPEHPHTVRGLGKVLEKSLRKAPGIGPALPKLANACANALCAMEGEAALAEVGRLTTRVTYRTTLNLLSAGLNARAEALGLGRDEVEELSVPSYGLTEVGRRVEDFGQARAELVVDSGRAELRWFNAAGTAVKSVPAAVRREHPDTVKELKAQAKDINTMLSAVAKRLDRQFLADREWAAHTWRERYLDHPLAGTVARRLIWTVDGTACRYTGGTLRDLAGEPVEVRGTVRLWHPVGRTVEEVMAWRDQLEQEGVTQPFKQAHREVYLLTEAERRTGTYSNRFAGHILRQYPFRSLAAERGWRDPQLRIAHHDTSYPPAMRDLPHWGMYAEYGVVGDPGQDLDSEPYQLLVADQVRFYTTDGSENSAQLPLEEVPAQVLSEVLRDVDLFVGVTSVGNDPLWQDGGPGGRFREYWSSYSFGELSETARTRHDLLERLLPRLAVGDRCRVEGRFLHVKGELHTYKIHLGSGNILMDPGDRYLCIVPDDVPAAASGTYLPFDGDRMLSLILSKALLLADDTKITDSTILSQIRPKA